MAFYIHFPTWLLDPHLVFHISCPIHIDLFQPTVVVFTKVHSWRLLPGFPLAPTLPPPGLVASKPSFQGNFNADRLSLHPSRTFQANISSARCFFGHQFKPIFQNKTIRGQQKIIPKCNFNCWCLLSSQSSGWHLHLCAVKSGAGLSSQSD